MKSGAARLWLRLSWASAVVALTVAASLLPHLRDSAELVRMRNALLVQAEPAVHEWTPAAVPADFALETTPPLPLYADTVARHGLKVTGDEGRQDDWATALAIGRHLLPDGRRSGGPIQADLADTYTRITRGGEGYCGDYADSFTGLATAAGLFSRPWAFSFDGFGGRGHIFNEVWDSGRGRWVMIDVFNNFYVTDGAGTPLSAMAFREALLRDAPHLKLVPVDPTASPGFRHDDKALDYYRRGLPEWYMWWGNNVFEYDRSPVVRTLGGVHRALEQLGGVAAGVHPQIRVLALPENQDQREAIRWLRVRLLAVVVLGGATVVFLAGWLLVRRRGQP
ncbi:transglutaminase domain-containing protein [Pseudothauera rhizosphaerae]|uniref:Transglutaminase domain-containing protein n=1 Tax=Pseudothauera rhizosphaerae TaxID=2565932 RepID=A0A4S4APK5_9RHOO|nr:transglutaminase domain-containing protein [Pseudothauera rhizosphaerae]THF61625.1 transglutaminase domain-containing protein [Pseudothauera rhizosphaerae]